jgi:hypothetical protein
MTGIDCDVPRKEDRRLAFMGYLSPDDSSMSAFLPEELATPRHHMIFCFEGGLAIKVYSTSARFTRDLRMVSGGITVPDSLT